MVAVVTPEGECEFVNSSFETVLGLSRRSMTRGSVFDWFVDPPVLRDTVAAVSNNAFSTSRLETFLRRPGRRSEALPVHVTVNQIDGSRNVVFEIVEIEQQNRQEREERALEQARSDQGADQEPRPRDQEPARRHPRRGAAARDGDRVALADRIHPGHHQGGRPPAAARRPTAGAASQAPRRRRRQHPRGVRARAGADPRRVPARPDDGARLRHLDPGVQRRSRAADPGGAQHRPQRRRGARRADRGRRRADHAAHAGRAPGDARQAPLSSGTGIAYRGQRPGHPRAVAREDLLSARVGPRRRLGPRPHARTDIHPAAPWHRRIRKRAGPDDLQDRHSPADRFGRPGSEQTLAA